MDNGYVYIININRCIDDKDRCNPLYQNPVIYIVSYSQKRGRKKDGKMGSFFKMKGGCFSI